jgi:uncharacterized membrane protein (DUF485 family)
MDDGFLLGSGVVVMALLLVGVYVIFSDFRKGPQ